MRIRRKITIAFFLVSSLVSVLLALFLYRFIEAQRLACFVHNDALTQLHGRFAQGASP